MTSTRQPMEDLMTKATMATSTTILRKKTMMLLTPISQLMRMTKSNLTPRMTSHLERSRREEMVSKQRLTRFNKCLYIRKHLLVL